MLTAYSKFAKYYDSFVEVPILKARLIQSWIDTYFSKATSILEIACGTGSVLLQLNNTYQKSGLDISNQMLEIAKRKLPEANFYNRDMREFNISQKYDVILCIYDSINHLLSFKDWKVVFNQAYEHLNSDGLFIFDVLTQEDFDEHSDDYGVSVREYDNDIVLESITKIAPNKIRTTTRMFVHVNNHNYHLYEEELDEVCFEVSKIKRALSKQFVILDVIDPARKKPSKKSKLLYFVCKKNESKN